MIVKMVHPLEYTALTRVAFKDCYASRWVYFGDFLRVTASVVRYKYVKEITTDYRSIRDESKDEYYVLHIIAKRDNGDMFVILTSFATFLINEKGETITSLFPRKERRV